LATVKARLKRGSGSGAHPSDTAAEIILEEINWGKSAGGNQMRKIS